MINHDWLIPQWPYMGLSSLKFSWLKTDESCLVAQLLSKTRQLNDSWDQVSVNQLNKNRIKMW